MGEPVAQRGLGSCSGLLAHRGKGPLSIITRPRTGAISDCHTQASRRREGSRPGAGGSSTPVPHLRCRARLFSAADQASRRRRSLFRRRKPSTGGSSTPVPHLRCRARLFSAADQASRRRRSLFRRRKRSPGAAPTAAWGGARASSAGGRGPPGAAPTAAWGGARASSTGGRGPPVPRPTAAWGGARASSTGGRGTPGGAPRSSWGASSALRIKLPGGARASSTGGRGPPAPRRQPRGEPLPHCGSSFQEALEPLPPRRR